MGAPADLSDYQTQRRTRGELLLNSWTNCGRSFDFCTCDMWCMYTTISSSSNATIRHLTPKLQLQAAHAKLVHTAALERWQNRNRTEVRRGHVLTDNVKGVCLCSLSSQIFRSADEVRVCNSHSTAGSVLRDYKLRATTDEDDCNWSENQLSSK